MSGAIAAPAIRSASKPGASPRFFAPGSHEEFIAEHDWGYSPGRVYRIEHQPWKIRGATRPRF